VCALNFAASTFEKEPFEKEPARQSVFSRFVGFDEAGGEIGCHNFILQFRNQA
jgi:hypothetical protein